MSDNQDDTQNLSIDEDEYRRWLEWKNQQEHESHATPVVEQQAPAPVQERQQRQQKLPRQGSGLLSRMLTSIAKQLLAGFAMGSVYFLAFATYVSVRVNAYASVNSMLNGVQGGGQDIAEKLKNPITGEGAISIDEWLSHMPDLVYVISPFERVVITLITIAVCVIPLIKLKPFIIVGFIGALLVVAIPYNEFFVVQDILQINWFSMMPEPGNPMNLYGFGASSN